MKADKYIHLLQTLIETASFSGEEEETAKILGNFLEKENISFYQEKNNLWAYNKHYDENKPTILLNSHHDTVKPNKGYKKDPFQASIEDGKLYGLGSNDAGGALVSLLATFIHFYDQEGLKYNLIFSATAEEENSGKNGIRSILTHLPDIDFAIVGEPTQMHLAIAEKGLIVIDALVKGKSGHVAHENTINPILLAVDDISILKDFNFKKESSLLGKTKVSVSQISAGTQHNVVPSECSYVIDVRVNELYSNLEVLQLLKENVKAELKARSTHLNSSSISIEHPFVQKAIEKGRKTYGSPTLSDQAHLSCPSLKLGPGDSNRSHSADEYIFVDEIKEGINLYIELLQNIL